MLSRELARIPVWLDCDPGHDDAFAIVLCGHNLKLKLLGISTVAGNQSVEKTTQNALTILNLAGLSYIDVVPGQATPLLRPSKVCPEIHGSSGLDCSIPLPTPKKKCLFKKAIIHMSEVIAEYPEPVTLIATGCLTNYALLLSIYPELKGRIKELVLLGGAMGIGNISPVAEFNILLDPEAAKIIFESGIRIVMIPLEVSHTVLVTQKILERISSLGSTLFSKIMIELLVFFSDTYKKVFKFEYPPLHDPLAVSYVIDPSIFDTELMRVDIEITSELSRYAGDPIVIPLIKLFFSFSLLYVTADRQCATFITCLLRERMSMLLGK